MSQLYLHMSVTSCSQNNSRETLDYSGSTRVHQGPLRSGDRQWTQWIPAAMGSDSHNDCNVDLNVL